MIPIDPLNLARRQLERDRKQTERFRHLFEHKQRRMSVSPLAFLRGAAPLFYALLRERPVLAEGPRGKGWLCGDMHLENFGAYHPDPFVQKGPSKRSRNAVGSAVFNMNDFDDCLRGPWRYDVLRLVTSLILGGRELGADGRRTIDLSFDLLDAYMKSAFDHGKLPPPPRPVVALITKVAARSRKELLDARTEVVKGARRFVRGERYRELPKKILPKAARAFAKYAKRLPASERPSKEQLEIVDMAFRVAGTGSLGCLRIAILVRGKGGVDGGWIFDMKEEGEPSGTLLLGETGLEPAVRVVTGLQACLEHPPRMIGATRLGGASMFVRRLTPQEDKLNLARIDAADLEGLARYLGGLLGQAHRLGASAPPKKRWTAGEVEGLVDRALTIAGIHEATYLALCRLAR